MAIALCIFSSCIALLYFAYKKWYAVSICYGSALALLIALIPFTSTMPSYLYDLFGEEFCLDLHFALTGYGYIVLAPYSAITLMSLIVAVVITLTVVEHVVLFCRAHSEFYEPVGRDARTEARRTAPTVRYDAKRYLVYCSMLC